MGGDSCAISHGTYLRTTTIFGNKAMINGDIDTASYGIGSIDTSSIKLVNNRMVYLESDAAKYFVVARTIHTTETPAIGITVRVALISKA